MAYEWDKLRLTRRRASASPKLRARKIASVRSGGMLVRRISRPDRKGFEVLERWRWSSVGGELPG